MNEQLSKIASTLAKGAGNAVTAVGQFAKECQRQADWMAAQRVAAMREAQVAMQKDSLQPEHEAFANAVANCLGNEYQNCGLQSLRRIEDIMCDDENNNIRINGTAAPDFSYEANRDFSSSSLRDIMSGSSQSVPAADIKKILNRSLRKYSTRRGYTFSSVTVDDIPCGKVRITAHDVGLTLREQQRRAGYSNYGYCR